MALQSSQLQHSFPKFPLLQLPQYGSFDDFAAMAVLLALTTLYFLRGVVWDKPNPYLYKLYERPQEKMGLLKVAESTRDIAQKLEQVGAEIVVFWGSQSGTAERMANRLCKEIGQRFGKKALAADMSDYDPSTLEAITKTKLAIFIVSTYGEGEPSDNLMDFCAWLNKASSTALPGLRYCAFGLGNSNYKYYNAVVDLVISKLDTFGAEAVLPVGKADDAKGETEEHYLDWKNNLFNIFKADLAFQEHDPVYEPSISITEDTSARPSDLCTGEPCTPNISRKAMRMMSPSYALPVKAARELFTDTTGRNCIHMEIDLSEQLGLKYKTGDHLGVWPQNPVAEVDRLVQALGLTDQRHTPLKIEQLEADIKLKVSSPTTIEALFGYYLEVCAPVSRETIGSLVQFAPTQAAKEVLTRLSNDKMAYLNLLESTYVNFGSLLQLAAPGIGAWSGLPLSFVLETLPAMQPRYYSISSSSVVQPRQVAITAVVADNVLSETGERISGLCTNYLLARKGLHDGTTHPNHHQYALDGPRGLLSSGKVFAHVRKSTFKLPAVQSQPIVMFAAGTGIAPFRAFLQERARIAKMGRPVGRTILFFGCRNERQDFIYRDELERLQEALGPALTIVTAFSRPDGGTKRYVQDKILEHSEEVCDLVVNGDANMYICGSASMARDVSKVLGCHLQAKVGWGDDELRQFMEKQRRIRRWQQDVWG